MRDRPDPDLCLSHKASCRRREGAAVQYSSVASFSTSVFDIRPLRGGAGRGSTARCRCELDVRFFFFSREKRAGAPLRGGAGQGSTRRCRCELDVLLLSPPPSSSSSLRLLLSLHATPPTASSSPKIGPASGTPRVCVTQFREAVLHSWWPSSNPKVNPSLPH